MSALFGTCSWWKSEQRSAQVNENCELIGWAGTGALPPRLARQFLFIYLCILRDGETSCEHVEKQVWSSLWVTCTSAARVTRSHGLPHICPHRTPLLPGRLPRVQGPSQNTSCPMPRPSQAPQPDEDGDRSALLHCCPITSASCCCCKKIAAPGRCHFPANTRQDSCVKEGDGCVCLVLWSKGGFPQLFLTHRQ